MADADTNLGPVEAPKGGASPTPEPPAPGPVTTATSQPDEPPPAEPTAPAPAATPAPEPKRDYAKERMQQKIDRLTAEKSARDEEIASLKAGLGAEGAKIQEQIKSEATKIAQEEAGKIAAWKEFENNLNGAIVEGQKEFGKEKFDKHV